MGGGVGAISRTNTANDFDTSTDTAYTFTNMDIGAEPSGGERRFIIVTSGTLSSAGSNPVLTDMDIQGLDAAGLASLSVGNRVSSGIWSVEVPTGTTATIEVTAANTCAACAISVYRVISGPDGITTTVDENGARPIDLVLNIPANSVAIATAMCRNAGSVTWTGLTEDYDQDIDSNDFFSSASDAFPDEELAFAIQAQSASAGDEEAGCAVAISPA